MNTFYFIRHAEPDHSWKEDSTRPLSKEGIVDRYLLVEYFKNKKVDIFYSSPYKRAFDTVKVIADYFESNVVIDERLKERIAGNGSNNQEMFYRRWEDFNFAEINGESIGNVQKRNIEALNEIIKKNDGKTIVIGTHGTALSSVLNYYDNSFSCTEFLRIINYMPFIVKVEIENDKCICIKEEYYLEKKYKN